MVRGVCFYEATDTGQPNEVARFALDGGTVRASGSDQVLIENILQDQIPTMPDGEIVTAQSNPEQFLSELVGRYKTVYLWATPLQELGEPAANYSPDQPRDESGRWTSGGGAVAPPADHPGRFDVASPHAPAHLSADVVSKKLTDYGIGSQIRDRVREHNPAGAEGGVLKLPHDLHDDLGGAIAAAVEGVKVQDIGKPAPPTPHKVGLEERREGMIPLTGAGQHPGNRPADVLPEEKLGGSDSPAALPLRSGAVVAQKQLGAPGVGHVNAAYKVTLDNGKVAAWKPKSGEETNLRNYVPNGTQYKREAAAYAVAEAIGMKDLVPPTTIRKVEDEIGSVQEWVAGKDAAKVPEPERYDGDKDGRRAAAFDYLIGNTDRHAGNWKVDGGKMHLIDHGLSLPTKHGEGGNYQMITRAGGKSIPSELASLKEQWPKIEAALKKCDIEPEAIRLCQQRAWKLAEGAAGGLHFKDLPVWYNDYRAWKGESSLHAGNA